MNPGLLAPGCPWAVFVAFLISGLSLGADTFRVATYNVGDYLIADRSIDGEWRPDYPKPEREKNALRAVILAVEPDILALQGMGGAAFLTELQRDLKSDGLDYPFAYALDAKGGMRCVAVLSRLEVEEVHAQTELDFPYFGGREPIKRGLLEVVVAADEGTWSLFVVHLKSSWTERPDDPGAELKRLGEATAARDRILDRHDPGAGGRYLIAGDFNDTRDTSPVRRFLQRGDTKISSLVPAADSRGHRWTQHQDGSDVYLRSHFLLASPAMKKQLAGEGGRIFDGPGSAIASAHRLIWADFTKSGTER